MRYAAVPGTAPAVVQKEGAVTCAEDADITAAGAIPVADQGNIAVETDIQTPLNPASLPGGAPTVSKIRQTGRQVPSECQYGRGWPARPPKELKQTDAAQGRMCSQLLRDTRRLSGRRGGCLAPAKASLATTAARVPWIRPAHGFSPSCAAVDVLPKKHIFLVKFSATPRVSAGRCLSLSGVADTRLRRPPLAQIDPHSSIHRIGSGAPSVLMRE